MAIRFYGMQYQLLFHGVYSDNLHDITPHLNHRSLVRFKRSSKIQEKRKYIQTKTPFNVILGRESHGLRAPRFPSFEIVAFSESLQLPNYGSEFSLLRVNHGGDRLYRRVVLYDFVYYADSSIDIAGKEKGAKSVKE